MSSKFTDEDRERILRESREHIEFADRMLAERRDPDALENIIPLVRKPKPEPELNRLSAVEQLAQSTAEQLDEFRDYISGELSDLLAKTFGATADVLDEMQSAIGDLKTKYIESDVANLRAEVAALRGEVDSTKALVDALVGAVAGLRDQVDEVETRGGASVVMLRKGSPP